MTTEQKVNKMANIATLMGLNHSEAIYIPASVTKIAEGLSMSEENLLAELLANVPMRAYIAQQIKMVARSH